MVYNQKYKIIF